MYDPSCWQGSPDGCQPEWPCCSMNGFGCRSRSLDSSQGVEFPDFQKFPDMVPPSFLHTPPQRPQKVKQFPDKKVQRKQRSKSCPPCIKPRPCEEPRGKGGCSRTAPQPQQCCGSYGQGYGQCYDCNTRGGYLPNYCQENGLFERGFGNVCHYPGQASSIPCMFGPPRCNYLRAPECLPPAGLPSTRVPQFNPCTGENIHKSCNFSMCSTLNNRYCPYNVLGSMPHPCQGSWSPPNCGGFMTKDPHSPNNDSSDKVRQKGNKSKTPQKSSSTRSESNKSKIVAPDPCDDEVSESGNVSKTLQKKSTNRVGPKTRNYDPCDERVPKIVNVSKTFQKQSSNSLGPNKRNNDPCGDRVPQIENRSEASRNPRSNCLEPNNRNKNPCDDRVSPIGNGSKASQGPNQRSNCLEPNNRNRNPCDDGVPNNRNKNPCDDIVESRSKASRHPRSNCLESNYRNKNPCGDRVRQIENRSEGPPCDDRVIQIENRLEDSQNLRSNCLEPINRNRNPCDDRASPIGNRSKAPHNPRSKSLEPKNRNNVRSNPSTNKVPPTRKGAPPDNRDCNLPFQKAGNRTTNQNRNYPYVRGQSQPTSRKTRSEADPQQASRRCPSPAQENQSQANARQVSRRHPPAEELNQRQASPRQVSRRHPAAGELNQRQASPGQVSRRRPSASQENSGKNKEKSTSNRSDPRECPSTNPPHGNVLQKPSRPENTIRGRATETWRDIFDHEANPPQEIDSNEEMSRNDSWEGCQDCCNIPVGFCSEPPTRTCRWDPAPDQQTYCSCLMRKNMTRGGAKKKKASAAKGSAPKGAAHQAADPQGADPEVAISRGASPKGATSKGTTPKGATPKGATPKGDTPKGATPKGASPKGGTPKRATPKGASKSKSSKKKNKVQESSDDMADFGSTGSPERPPKALEMDQQSESAKKAESQNDCSCGCDEYSSKPKPEMRSCSCYANLPDECQDQESNTPVCKDACSSCCGGGASGAAVPAPSTDGCASVCGVPDGGGGNASCAACGGCGGCGGCSGCPSCWNPCSCVWCYNPCTGCYYYYPSNCYSCCPNYGCCYAGCCGSCCIPKLPPPYPDVTTPSKKSKDPKESSPKKAKAGNKNGKGNDPRNPGGTDLNASPKYPSPPSQSTASGYPLGAPNIVHSMGEMDSGVRQRRSKRKLALEPSTSNDFRAQ